MGAFVCIFHRDGHSVEERQLRRLAAPLAVDGAEISLHCRGPLGLAVRHRPHPHAPPGPLTDPDSGRVAALAGRLEVLGGAETPEYGDGAAALLTAGTGEIGTFLAGTRGSFAAVVAEPARGRLHLARDHLGDVPVHYVLDSRRLLAASDPAALLRHDAVSRDPDEASVTRFLAFRSAHDGRSFFRRIRSLPPGHLLRVSRDGEERTQYWRLRRLPRDRSRPPEVVAADFLDRLEDAVAASAAGFEPGAVAVSLSGGLDSAAVAAVAPPGVRAFSWTFADTPEADEAERVEAVCRHLRMPLTRVPGDALHPLSGDLPGFAERFVHAGSPVVNPFAALKHRLYRAAREAGCTLVLVGDGGDAVYGPREYWLRDLLADRRPGALRSLAVTLGRALRGDPFARLALRRVPPLDGLRRALRPPPPWLTPEARAALPAAGLSPILPPGRRGARYELCAGPRHGELESGERDLAARCGVARGNPFWSWPLLEAAMQLPAYHHHRDDRGKPLSRLALRGRLPAAVLEGTSSGLLGGYFLRGLEQARDGLRDALLRHPRSDWQRHVRRDWLEPYLEATDSIAFGHTILWRVISYELWVRRLLGAP